MATPLLPVLRTGVFAFVILASVIVLALCAHVTNTTVSLFEGYFVFAALGIATSLLAFLSLPVMLIVDNMRKGAVTSMILMEIAWLVFGYLATLITLSFILANRGYNRVWYQSVKGTEFNAPPVTVHPMAVPPQQSIPAQNPGTYPPQVIPALGWAGTPQQAPATVPYTQA
ncbi:hypothetical protein C0995_015915 [Termitomyces sp. Mi166|nr:hypothetical protein C0995_015915 [Termitomyces sp. Mi166\